MQSHENHDFSIGEAFERSVLWPMKFEVFFSGKGTGKISPRSMCKVMEVVTFYWAGICKICAWGYVNLGFLLEWNGEEILYSFTWAYEVLQTGLQMQCFHAM